MVVHGIITRILLLLEAMVEMLKDLVETHKHQAEVQEEETLMVVQEEKFGLL